MACAWAKNKSSPAHHALSSDALRSTYTVSGRPTSKTTPSMLHTLIKYTVKASDVVLVAISNGLTLLNLDKGCGSCDASNGNALPALQVFPVGHGLQAEALLLYVGPGVPGGQYMSVGQGSVHSTGQTIQENMPAEGATKERGQEEGAAEPVMQKLPIGH